ncbi:uncharacterized protein LOC131267246 [Anopheles coustani]|uniref:uncharacterized protein LOC131267246 n=1 Tax=Anopheles coustani TaxID=139045 RepID=UPI002657D79B|nr:uncharacterized protein LOC131267246 [Anopheles coustani]
MKPTPSWWSFTVVVLLCCLLATVTSGESYLKRWDTARVPFGGIRALLGLPARHISEEETRVNDSSTSSPVRSTDAPDEPAADNDELDTAMTNAPYLTLALKVLLMAILCYTL